MNGDTAGKVARLQRELQQLRYPGTVDEVGLRLGDPVALLPVLHFVLLKFSRHVAKTIHKAGYELQGKTDQKFVESAFKLFRDSFGIRTVLTHAYFLEQGFAERKLLLLSDVISGCKKIHNDEVRKERLAALKTKPQGAPGPESRLYEPPKKTTPEVKVVKAIASGRTGARRSLSPNTRPALPATRPTHTTHADTKPRAASRHADRGAPHTPHDQDSTSHRTNTHAQGPALAALHTPVHSWFLDPPARTQPRHTDQVAAGRDVGSAAGPGPHAGSPLGPGLGSQGRTGIRAGVGAVTPAWFTNPAFLDEEEGEDDTEPWRDTDHTVASQHTRHPHDSNQQQHQQGPHGQSSTGPGSFRFHNPYLQLPAGTSTAAAGARQTDKATPSAQRAAGGGTRDVKGVGSKDGAGKGPQIPLWQRSFAVETWRAQGVSAADASDSSDDDDVYRGVRHDNTNTRSAIDKDTRKGGVAAGGVDDGGQGTDQGLAHDTEHTGNTQQQGARVPTGNVSLQGGGGRQVAYEGGKGGVISGDRDSDRAIDDMRLQVQALTQAVKGLQTALEEARAASDAATTAAEARVTVLEARVRHMECELDSCVRRGEYQPPPRPSPSAHTTTTHTASPPTAPTPTSDPHPSAAFGSVSPAERVSPPTHAPPLLPSWLARTHLPPVTQPQGPGYAPVAAATTQTGSQGQAHDAAGLAQAGSMHGPAAASLKGGWGAQGDTLRASVSATSTAAHSATADAGAGLQAAPAGGPELAALHGQADASMWAHARSSFNAAGADNTAHNWHTQPQHCSAPDTVTSAHCGQGQVDQAVPDGTPGSLSDSYLSHTQQQQQGLVGSGHGESISVSPQAVGTATADYASGDATQAGADTLRQSVASDHHQSTAQAGSHGTGPSQAMAAQPQAGGSGGVDALLRQSGALAQGAEPAHTSAHGFMQSEPYWSQQGANAAHMGYQGTSEAAQDMVSAASVGAWVDRGTYDMHGVPHGAHPPTQPPVRASADYTAPDSYGSLSAHQQLPSYPHPPPPTAISMSFGQDMFAPAPCFSFDPSKVMAAAQQAVSSQDTPFLPRAGIGRGSTASLRNTVDSLSGVPTAQASWYSSSDASVAAPAPAAAPGASAQASWDYVPAAAATNAPQGHLHSSVDGLGAVGTSNHSAAVEPPVRASQSWDRGGVGQGTGAYTPTAQYSATTPTHVGTYATGPMSTVADGHGVASVSGRGSLSSTPWMQTAATVTGVSSGVQVSGQYPAHYPAAAGDTALATAGHTASTASHLQSYTHSGGGAGAGGFTAEVHGSQGWPGAAAGRSSTSSLAASQTAALPAAAQAPPAAPQAGASSSTRDLIANLLSRNTEAQSFLKELNSYRRK